MNTTGWRFVLAALLTVQTLAVAIAAEEKEKPAAARPTSNSGVVAGLAKKRAAVRNEIERLAPSDAESTEKPDADAQRNETLALLRSLDAIYVQQQNRVEQVQQIEAQIKEANKELETLDKFKPDEPKPYSFLLLESLHDQSAVEEDREEAIEADLKSAKQLLKFTHAELDEASSALGKQAEKSAEKVASDQPAARGELSLAELPLTIGRAKVSLKQSDIEVHTQRLELCQLRQKQFEKKIEAIKKDVAFAAQDRDRQLQRLAGQEADLKRRRREVETKLQQLEPQQRDALRELSAAQAPSAAVETATSAWHAAAETLQTEIVILDQQIESMTALRSAWKQRYELANSKLEPKKLAQWLDELDEQIAQLKVTSRSLEHRRDTVRDDQAIIDREKQEHPAADADKWRDMRLANLQELRDLTETTLGEIATTQRALGRFRTDLKAKLKAAPTDWQTSLKDSWKSLVAFEVSGKDDEAITVGRLLILVVAVVVGMMLAYGLSRLIGRRIIPWMALSSGTVSALRSITFYALCVVFGIAAFRMLNIPLAAFAFLGGAAAIAVGFGSQDIMNNFMSGIILLTEQPIRVGDVVMLDDVQGVVQHIGLRSTRLRTDLNHEMIVPNHTLLDEQVTNLTLSDNFVQMFVTVTLDRVVDVQPAMRKMLEVVFAHPLVLKSPRPQVLLKEFDTYWSVFEVHFSLQHSSFMRLKSVQSEILEGISEHFKAPSEEGESSEEAKAGTTVPAATNAATAASIQGQLLLGMKKLGGKLR